MNGLSRLIREMRRRRVFRVVGIYIGAAAFLGDTQSVRYDLKRTAFRSSPANGIWFFIMSSIAAASQMVCHECDLLVGVPPLDIGQKAFCPRCDYLLAANRPHAQPTVFAFSVTALSFLTLANLFPFLGFSARGQERTVTLLESVGILVTENLPALAVVVFASIIAIPALFLIGIAYVSVSLAIGKYLPGTRTILRWVLLMMPWSMAEIFIIGILVSFIKIVSLADVALGLSFWSYAAFTVCMIVVVLHMDKREIWRRVGELSNA